MVWLALSIFSSEKGLSMSFYKCLDNSPNESGRIVSFIEKHQGNAEDLSNGVYICL